ncbi:MAG TPA: flagellar hook-basal body complex protein [Verrucomicrobiae bacterium]|jgi:flagellar hook protein FlgE|nr:flagellar hook-basal body complex protein [Verrucomicrobiae bacterium]
MLLSMDSGVSALEQFQQQLNVISNNIANVNTVGFKAANVNFADTLSETLGSNAAGSTQVGTGVTTASITNDFSTPGAITNTGVESNLAIQGNGFFVVKDPTSGQSYVTQDGTFTVDNNGYLVTSSGMRLQGTAGDIKIAGTSTASVSSYTIGTDGTVTVNLSDNTSTAVGQVELQNFANPDQLLKVGGNLYTPTAAAGASTAAAAGSNGLGTIQAGSLEMSNVDLAGQLTSLITVQSAYEANSKVITTSDNVLQTLTNLIR